MTQAATCPKCGRADLLYNDKRQLFICKDCDHVFAADVRVSPLRIFLSYGHDSNEDLVLLIRADLARRGHDVWVDRNDIKCGDDWRREITDGIMASNRVLSFLSKHSTRDPGVCRDEIALALGAKDGNIQTILVEGETEVQPPVSIGHIQWLDMHEWKVKRAEGRDAWDRWYQPKLDEIIRVVESDASRRFAGEIDTLQGYLRPIRSDARICDLLQKGFVGRQWLFAAVESWQQAPAREERLFWITGEPGAGKSAFAAQFAHTRSDIVIAAQFVEWDKPDHRDPRRVVRSLAFQLAARLPDYRKLLLALPEIAALDRLDPAELFDYLLSNPLRCVIDGGRARCLIVIDALDEAGDSGQNVLVEMLARHAQRLPGWIGFVATSRPTNAVCAPLQGLNPRGIDTQTDSNRADLRQYLRQQLGARTGNGPDAERLIDRIVDKSGGVFLYLEHFCDAVRKGWISLASPEQFPQGLGSIFFEYLRRAFPDELKYRREVRPVLPVLLAAREPLPVEILMRIFNWREPDLNDFIRRFDALLRRTQEGGVAAVKIYHQALADWLVDEARAGVFLVSPGEGHERLADAGWAPSRPFGPDAAAYFGRYLPYHVAASGQWDRLAELLADPNLDLLRRWSEQGDLAAGRFCLLLYITHLRETGETGPYQQALMVQLARIEVRAGNLLEAAPLLGESLEALKREDQPLLYAVAAHEYGSVCLQQGGRRQARAWYRRALEAARSCQPPAEGEVAANLVALATSYQIEQRFGRRVERLARSALAAAQRAHDAPHTAEAHRLLADMYKDSMRYREAEDHLAEGLTLARREGLPYAEMPLLAAQAWMLYQRAALGLGRVDAAKDTFRSLDRVAAQVGHARFRADAWCGLGQCGLLSHCVDEIDEAVRRLGEAGSGGIPVHARVRRLLLDAGKRYQQGDLPGALSIYQEAAAVAVSARLPQRHAEACVGGGAALWHLRDHAAARREWKLAVSAARPCPLVRRRLVAASIRRARRDGFATPL